MERSIWGNGRMGKSAGKGTFTLPNGSKYLGKWRGDKPWNVKFVDKKGNILIKIANGVLQKRIP